MILSHHGSYRKPDSSGAPDRLLGGSGPQRRNEPTQRIACSKTNDPPPKKKEDITKTLIKSLPVQIKAKTQRETRIGGHVSYLYLPPSCCQSLPNDGSQNRLPLLSLQANPFWVSTTSPKKRKQAAPNWRPNRRGTRRTGEPHQSVSRLPPSQPSPPPKQKTTSRSKDEPSRARETHTSANRHRSEANIGVLDTKALRVSRFAFRAWNSISPVAQTEQPVTTTPSTRAFGQLKLCSPTRQEPTKTMATLPCLQNLRKQENMRKSETCGKTNKKENPKKHI